MGITADDRKLALLFHFGGEHVHDLYDTLDHTRQAVAGAQEEARLRSSKERHYRTLQA